MLNGTRSRALRTGAVAVLALVAGCTPAGSPGSVRSPGSVPPPGHGGTVTGTLMFQGPQGPPGHPVPGTVTAFSKAEGTFTVTAGKSGKFRFYLPAGTYTLTGSSPEVTINSSPAGCGRNRAVRVTDRVTVAGIIVSCGLI